MRRYENPFNGNRYLLNKSTGEIHDLDNELPQCRISEMNPDNIINCMSYEDAWLRGKMISGNPNSCYYCTPANDKG